MAYTSFGTRRALGRKYSVDPALLLESERLKAEYSLAPGREARGMQASQFAQGLELRREEMKGAERGGMFSSLLQAPLAGAITYGVGKQVGLWGGGAAGAGTSGGGLGFLVKGVGDVGVPMYPGLTSEAGAAATGMGAGVTTPALMDTAGLSTMAAPGTGGTAVAGGSAAGGMALGQGVGAGAAGFAAGYGLQKTGIGKAVSDIMPFGGTHEWSSAGGAAAGAGAGFLIGGPPGMILGGIIGAIGGSSIGEKIGDFFGDLF